MKDSPLKVQLISRDTGLYVYNIEFYRGKGKNAIEFSVQLHSFLPVYSEAVLENRWNVGPKF